MNNNRRNFIKTTATGLAITVVSGKLLGCMPGSKSTSASSLKNFGMQLYTLRDVLPQDPKGVLKQLADMGYKQIESYEGAKGMFWGMSNTDFKKYMDDLGMKIISSHCSTDKEFERKAAEAAEIGMNYLLVPWVGPQKKMDDFKKLAEKFNEYGQICKSAGIKFGYHNHDYSFKLLEGQLPQDVMMQNTDPALVDFEMDIYWVYSAGQDPIRWLEKYPDRFRLCHVKDRKKDVPFSNPQNVSCVLGQGEIDFPKILTIAKKKGMQYYIVEQEAYENHPPIESAKLDAEYMKKISL